MTKKNIFLSSVLICIALFAVGCLVSGTFVISETFNFTTHAGFYAEAVNLDGNADWEEHRDKLDKVDVVGFEIWITNNEPTEWSFWAYMDEYDEFCLTPMCATISPTKFLIFDTLTIPASTSESVSTKYVSYAESFQHIRNFEKIKQMVFDGSFNFFAYADGSSGIGGGTVDSIRVIITVSASDT